MCNCKNDRFPHSCSECRTPEEKIAFSKEKREYLMEENRESYLRGFDEDTEDCI